VPIGTALLAATTAFQLVKDGCALYKEVKGVAGNVQQIYNEINGQFAGKKVSKAQAEKIQEEKQRVEKVAATDPDMVMFKISDDLGNMFDQIDKIESLFWEQEREAKKLQKADVSLKRMALRRLTIRAKLVQMHADLKHVMIYESPPELGSLWTDFENMRAQIKVEQEQARVEQEKRDELDRRLAEFKYEQFIRNIQMYVAIVVGVAVIVGFLYSLTVLVKYHRELLWGF
jgi:chromosome segregation ATPase